jgi:hypothetical protein
MDDQRLEFALIFLIGIMALVTAQQSLALPRHAQWNWASRDISPTWAEEMEGIGCAYLENINCPDQKDWAVSP